MKALAMAAALSLAVVPAMGHAQSAAQPSDDEQPQVEAGGVAQDPSAILNQTIPFEAFIALGFTIAGVVALGFVILQDDDNNTVTVTTST